MLASSWHCATYDFDLSTPILMGILNVTPDSFSDGGEHDTPDAALEHARRLMAAGADIIDVGGESTRPGAAGIDVQTELSRVLPIVRELSGLGVAVSIDTRHAPVADACVDAGACIINDVSGFRDADMRAVAAHADCGLVVMHMRGTPDTMQDAPHYDDVVTDVERELSRMAARLEAEGVERERICLDPGIGFGKNLMHNLELIAATPRLAQLGYPLMAAVSRKSFIGAITGQGTPALRDGVSGLCAAFMAGQGASVIRAHDVGLTARMLHDSRRAIIGLGSNEGDAAGTIDAALLDLRANPDIWVASVSAYYLSEPAYYEAQPPFVNAVAVLQTTLGPRELLHELLAIERAHGRVRTVENGPRTLDLDIIDYEGLTCQDEDLRLPHPLALERDFVVTPLLSILPGHALADGTKVTHDGVMVGKVSSIVA